MKPVVSAAAVVLAVLSSAAAQSVAVTDHARTTLYAEAMGVAPGGTVRLALHQTLEKGWHVYWKNPGDSGLPLETLWTLPDGAGVSAVDYPTPERIEIGPLVNYGHEGEPVFLATLTAPANTPPGSAIDIALEATWLICAEICVPETGLFSLSIPVVADPAPDAVSAAIFSAADAAAPPPAAAVFRIDAGVLAIEAEGLAEGATGAYFFPEADNIVAPSAAQRFERRGDSVRLTASTSSAEADAPLKGVILVETPAGARGYAIEADIDGSLSVAAASGPIVAAAAPTASLAGLLVAALLGGALLNLMPCVFPILFVKAASIASTGANAGAMRRHGVLYAAGVLVTFAALGATLVGLRAAGEGLGWGFHLQSPIVVALSAYVLFAVGLNLAGAFSIGGGFQNVGAGLVTAAKGDLAAFLTGVLAVFVAAPCVGPFLTAPIGAAAVLPPVAGMAIFLTMGLGLAAPYLALTFSPALARRLPKPGPWMERFRQALAFPVFAAAAYFLWVLSAQTGGPGLALALGGLVFLGMATRLWEWGRTAGWARAGAALALLAALVPAVHLRPAAAVSAVSGYGGAATVAFDAADIDRRRAAGEAIFIDFTAAWCVICQVNKATVFSSKRVADAFARANVTLAVADWTNRDEGIERALASFGANGVPLYVFYPPGAPPVILPQPLTETTILALIDPKAKGDRP